MEFKQSHKHFRGFYSLIVLLLFFTFIPFALSGCGGGGGSGSSSSGNTATPSSSTGENIALFQTSGNTSPLYSGVVDQTTNEVIGTFVNRDSSGNPTNISVVSYLSPSGQVTGTTIGSDGLPTEILNSDGSKIVYTNYTPDSVDVTIYDSSGGIVAGPYTMPVDSSQLNQLKSLYAKISSEFLTNSVTISSFSTGQLWNDINTFGHILINHDCTSSIQDAAISAVTIAVTSDATDATGDDDLGVVKVLASCVNGELNYYSTATGTDSLIIPFTGGKTISDSDIKSIDEAIPTCVDAVNSVNSASKGSDSIDISSLSDCLKDVFNTGSAVASLWPTTKYKITGNVTGTVSGSIIPSVLLSIGLVDGNGITQPTNIPPVSEYMNNNTTYTFTPLANNTTYTITPSLAGYSFNPPEAIETINNANIANVNFTATPASVPTVVSPTYPADNSTDVSLSSLVSDGISVTFSEPMLGSSISPSIFTVKGPNGSVTPAYDIIYSPYNSSTIYVFHPCETSPSCSLTSNATYTVTVTTGAESSNNIHLANNYTWTFTTAGTLILPQVVFISPSDQGTNVTTSQAITATFNEAMDSSTINSSTFTLTSNGTSVPGTVSCNSENNTATFKPNSPLLNNADYTATITTGVENLNGTQLSSNYSWTFTTAAGSSVSSVPQPPTNLTATAGDSQVTLNWTASSGATSYDVLEYNSSTGTYASVALNITATTNIVTGLTDGTTYYFEVEAVNSAGTSSPSTSVSATPAVTITVPSAPTNLTATPGNTQAVLSWTASMGATGYNVYYSTSSGGTWTLLNSSLVTGTTETVTNLTNGAVYYFVVTAVSSAGESGDSNQVSVTAAAAGVMAIHTYVAGSEPVRIAIDESGNVWVTNHGNGTAGTAIGDSNVTELSPSGATLGTYAVEPYPFFIAIDESGNVWVLNYGNSTGVNVTELSPSGATLGTYAVGGVLPYAIAVDESGNVWVANWWSSNVTELSPSGATLGTYAVGYQPSSIAVDGKGNVWVTNYGDDTVTELSSTGAQIGTYAVGTNPGAIAIDESGNVWVPNGGSGNVTELNPSGAQIGTYAVGLGPWEIAIDGSGNVWVPNSGSGNVTELDPSGAQIGTYAVGSGPQGIAIDASGNVWVANGGNGTIGTATGDSNVTELVGAATGVPTPLVKQPK